MKKKDTSDRANDLAQNEKVLRKVLQDSRILQRLSNYTINAQNPKVFYDTALAASMEMMYSDFASIQAFLPDSHTLHLLAHQHLHPDTARQLKSVPAGPESPYGKVFTDEGKPLIIRDIEKATGSLAKESRKAYQSSGILAVLSMPLISRSGQKIGIMSAYWLKVYDPSAYELDLFEILARQVTDFLAQNSTLAALGRSEDKYRALFDNIEDAFCLIELIFDQESKVKDFVYLEENPAHKNRNLSTDTTKKESRERFPDAAPKWLTIFQNVYQTGEAYREEVYNEHTNRWYRFSYSRVGGAGSPLIAGVSAEISARKQQAELQAFMLRLKDALRPLKNAADIQLTAVSMLGKQLSANRVAYAENLPGNTAYQVLRNYVQDAADLAGRYLYADYGNDLFAGLFSGNNRIQPDLSTDEGLTPEQRNLFMEAGIGASMNVPLLKGGQLVAFIGVNYNAPHHFTRQEIELVEAVTERTWLAIERARAEEALRESEERFQSTANLVPDLLWESEPDGSTNWYNQRWLEYTGQRFEASIGWGWVETIHPDDREASAKRYVEAVKKGTTLQQEHRIRRSDGEYRWFVVSAYPVKNESGRVVKMYGAATDIHDRKQTEEALRESEAKYRELFERIDEGFCIIEMIFDGEEPSDYRFIEVNPAFERQTGVINAKGRRMRAIAPDHEQHWFDRYGHVALTGQTQRFEAYSKAFGRRWYDLHAFRVGRPGQNLVAIVFSDITVRKKTAAALQNFNRQLEKQVKERTAELHQNRALLEATLDSNMEMIQVFKAVRNQQGKIVDFIWILNNTASEQIYGDVIGKSLIENNPGVAATGILEHFIDVTETGLPQQYEKHYIFEQFDGWFFQSVVKLDDGVATMTQDITHRKQAEFQLKESRDRLQSILDTTLVQMSILQAIRNQDGTITDLEITAVNHELEKETGRTDLVGKYYATEYPGIREAGLFDLIVKAVETGEPQATEYFYPYEGFHKWFSCMFVKLEDGVVATNMDITARKQAEDERFKNYLLLKQSEELARLGSWDYDLTTLSFTWSDGMYRLFDLNKGTEIKPEIYLDYTTIKGHSAAERVVQHIRSGDTDFEETLELNVSGKIKVIRLKAAVVYNTEGHAERVLGVDMDISAMQAAEETIRKMEAEQQLEIFRVSLETLEEERQRISESLHNGIAQILYGIKINMTGFKYGLTEKELLENKAYTSKLLTEAIIETRRISHELMPTTLEQFGLKSAIDDVCRQLTDGTKFHCHVNGPHGRMEKYLELAIYRTVQELLSNVVKHANATKCDVLININLKEIRITVRDNGQGMAKAAPYKPGIGLASIRSKVKLLSGTVKIDSEPHSGTNIEIMIPQPGKKYNPESL